jgi:hypothetical protein
MSVFGGTVDVHILSSSNNSWPFISESDGSDSVSSTCSILKHCKMSSDLFFKEKILYRKPDLAENVFNPAVEVQNLHESCR